MTLDKNWTELKEFTSEKFFSSEVNKMQNNIWFLRNNIALGAAEELTITTGAVTITKSYHKIDTEGDAASDNLDSIGGGEEGQIILLRGDNLTRTVTLRTGVGNLILGEDIMLYDPYVHVWLLKMEDGNWILLGKTTMSFGLLVKVPAAVFINIWETMAMVPGEVHLAPDTVGISDSMLCVLSP